MTSVFQIEGGTVTEESYIGALPRKVGQELLLCPSVAAVIVDEAGRLLLQEKRSGEVWSLPAGGIEPGETPQEAIQREVLEETGWEVEVADIIGVYGGADGSAPTARPSTPSSGN
jgi:8-oxo-dGTP pyrophosphatase MutT (NUDIX family)